MKKIILLLAFFAFAVTAKAQVHDTIPDHSHVYTLLNAPDGKFRVRTAITGTRDSVTVVTTQPAQTTQEINDEYLAQIAQWRQEIRIINRYRNELRDKIQEVIAKINPQ